MFPRQMTLPSRCRQRTSRRGSSLRPVSDSFSICITWPMVSILSFLFLSSLFTSTFSKHTKTNGLLWNTASHTHLLQACPYNTHMVQINRISLSTKTGHSSWLCFLTFTLVKTLGIRGVLNKIGKVQRCSWVFWKMRNLTLREFFSSSVGHIFSSFAEWSTEIYLQEKVCVYFLHLGRKSSSHNGLL